MLRRFVGLLLVSVNAFAGEFDVLWEETLSAYARFGGNRYMIQEEITQINHVLQAAAIAKAAGAPDEFVVALLYHDVGQVIREQNIGHLKYLHQNHAEIGAAWLEEAGFPRVVRDFVYYHALAKVVLCERVPNYYENLSEASRISYHIQREKYEGDEGFWSGFLSHPLLEYFLAARMCDDMAKCAFLGVERGNLPGFDQYEEMVKRSLEGESDMSDSWIETVKKWHQEMMESREDFEEKINYIINN